MTEEYVKISTSTEGDALVEILSPTLDTANAIGAYKITIKRLQEEGFTVANDKANEIKATNDNTKFQPTVTVKGRGNQVVDTYIAELKRMSIQ